LQGGAETGTTRSVVGEARHYRRHPRWRAS